MERWRIFLKIALSLSIFSTLLLGRIGYASPVRVFTASVGHSVAFQELPELLLDAEQYSAVAEFTFRSNTAFDLRSLQIALNGKLAQLGSQTAKDFSRWENRQGTLVLRVELGRMQFGGKLFADRVKELQKLGARAQVWLSGCERARAAQIYFIKRVGFESLPTLSWVGAKPASFLSKASIQFHFKSSDPRALTECRLGTNPFSICKPGIEYRNLANGWHTFQARALGASGKPGTLLEHSFWVFVPPPAVQIVKTIPAESPTDLDTFQAFFRLNWSFGPWTRTECSIDSKPYAYCQSGVFFKGLESGDHVFKVRIRANFWRFIWVSKPSEYAWTVTKEPLQLYWAKTPESETSSKDSLFEIGSNRRVPLECLLDGSFIPECGPSLVLKDLSDGEHFLVVTAREREAASARLEYRWLVDTTAPEARVLAALPADAVTNQSTMSLSFLLSEPGVARCFFNGAALASCASPIVLSEVPEGSNELVIEPVDRLGNTGARVAYRWEVDLTAPELSLVMLSPTQLPTNQRSAVFSWAGQENAFCQLDKGPEEPCQSPLKVEGLSHGEHVLTVLAVDAAGNRSEEKSIAWEVDLVAPSLSLVSLSPDERVTESNSFELSFSSELGALTTCDLDSSGPAPCASPFLASQLADGVHSLVIVAKDPAGNVSNEIRHQWTIASRTNVKLLSSSVSDLVNVSNARFEFAALGALRFECALDGASFSLCQSPVELSALADGAHRFAVRALNSAEVPGDVAEVSWRIDTTAPVVTLVSADPSETVTSRNSLTLSFSSNEESDFLCSLDGAASSPCASPMVWTDLPDGNHSVVISARDAAGNEGQAAYAWRVLTAPLQIGAVAVQSLTRTSAVIRWTTNFPAAGRVAYGVGETAGFEAGAPQGTSFSVPLTGLTPDTVYQAQVLVTDRDGRIAVSSVFSFSTLR